MPSGDTNIRFRYLEAREVVDPRIRRVPVDEAIEIRLQVALVQHLPEKEARCESL